MNRSLSMVGVVVGALMMSTLACGGTTSEPTAAQEATLPATQAPPTDTAVATLSATRSPEPSATATQASTPREPPTPTLAKTITPTVTRTAQPSPTHSSTPVPSSSATANVNLRAGPGTDHPVVGALKQGESADIVGRTSDGAWYKVKLASGSIAWVSAAYVSTESDPDALPTVPSAGIPTAPAPTATSPPAATATPAATGTTAPAKVVIATVNKKLEYVDIQNVGGIAQSLNGWVLRSEKGSQDCPLGGVLEPGAALRIYAESKDADKGGYNCGFGGPIWNNSDPDPAALLNADGQEVDRK